MRLIFSRSQFFKYMKSIIDLFKNGLYLELEQISFNYQGIEVY
jgi:hypothetical protein